MINFSRRDRVAETNEGLKAALTAASYGGAPAPANTTTNSIAQTGVAARQPSPRGPATRDAAPYPAAVSRDTPIAATQPASTAAPGAAVSAASSGEAQGSKLFIGVNILLKGVEISNCDTLVIEGNVEATVNSKVMEIAKPGTLKGTALIDVAEIHGDFSGELTARSRLVVHGTGRVSGTIRYGKLIVAEGGELSGDIKCLDEASQRPKPSHESLPDPHALPSSQPAH
jgi:cytoskeletal protein CcmA (bactofilin family)